MDEAEMQMRQALRVANEALERYQADGEPRNFRMWRDSQELAVKWYRQWRLGGGDTDESFDEGLQRLMSETS